MQKNNFSGRSTALIFIRSKNIIKPEMCVSVRSPSLAFIWISRLSNCFRMQCDSSGHSKTRREGGAIGFASVKILFPGLGDHSPFPVAD